MFSWIRHYVAEVCAPPSTLLVWFEFLQNLHLIGRKFQSFLQNPVYSGGCSHSSLLDACQIDFLILCWNDSHTRSTSAALVLGRTVLFCFWQLPISLNLSYHSLILVRDGGFLPYLVRKWRWTCMSDLISINRLTHWAFSCGVAIFFYIKPPDLKAKKTLWVSVSCKTKGIVSFMALNN